MLDSGRPLPAASHACDNRLKADLPLHPKADCMPNERDWRLSFQSEHLRSDVQKSWTQTRPDREHDHCAFCWAKIGPESMPDVLHQGFSTADEYDWVCPKCFADFKDELQLKLAT
jgi:hypothetical protein